MEIVVRISKVNTCFHLKFILYYSRKNIQQEKNDIDQKRVNDILNSLKAREKQIVTFLLENNYQATQAKIISGTGIPKTSLMRTLDSLVMRNIIQVQKIQKAKKITLTSWFLGNE